MEKLIMHLHPEVEKWLKANFNVNSRGDVSGSFNLKFIGEISSGTDSTSYSYEVIEVGDLLRYPINAAFKAPQGCDSSVKLTGFIIPNEGYTKIDPPIDLEI